MKNKDTVVLAVETALEITKNKNSLALVLKSISEIKGS